MSGADEPVEPAERRNPPAAPPTEPEPVTQPIERQPLVPPAAREDAITQRIERPARPAVPPSTERQRAPADPDRADAPDGSRPAAPDNQRRGATPDTARTSGPANPDRGATPDTARTSGPDDPDAGEDEEEEFGLRSFLRELAVIVVTALVISVLVKTFLVQAFYIPSGSMENTLLINDRVMVNKLDHSAGDIHRGDIVVFRDPGGWLETTPRNDSGVGAKIRDALVFLGLAPATSDDDLIKRVIGVGGDHVVCCDRQDRIMVNGVPLNESSYLFPGSVPSEQRFDVTVPKGYLWLMGDHRAVSEDSRAHHVDGEPDSGMVPVSDVIGRAFVIVWPLDRIGRLSRPATFDQAGLRSGPS